MTTATTTTHICPLWRRLIALLYDLVAVLAIVMTVGLLCELATHGRLITTGEHVHIAWWYQPLQALVVAAYFMVSWLHGGQTLGMRPWRIRVTTLAGGTPSLGQAMARLLVASIPLSMLLWAPVMGLRASVWCVLGAWLVWFGAGLANARRRPLHDLMAGTELRQVG